MVVPSAWPKRGGMPLNGAFQGRETFSTRDRFVPMPWMPGSFAFAAEVLEMRWSQRSGSGSGSGILGGVEKSAIEALE